MKYWWVNHKQTFKEEVTGGYIWSPQKNSNGSRNQTYLNLTRTKTGNLIFSYANTKIQCLGIIDGEYKESVKPEDFGSKGDNWANKGYLVPVNWIRLNTLFSPQNHIHEIAPLLPKKYSPIQKNGKGNQSTYLAEISESLFTTIFNIINKENPFLNGEIDDIRTHIEEQELLESISEENIPPTVKEQVIKSRLGQGVFRDNVFRIENKCRVTGVATRDFLIASHIKPWRFANDKERLDGNNGLVLSPHIDKLFDKGFISFKNNGDLLISSQLDDLVFIKWSLSPENNVGKFNPKQSKYLEYHRENIFKG